MQLCELGQEVRYDQILLLSRPSRLQSGSRRRCILKMGALAAQLRWVTGNAVNDT